MDFRFLHLRGADWQSVSAAMADPDLSGWRSSGAGLWGVWRGVFGLASTDLYVILSGETGAFSPPDGVETIDDRALTPTARPTDAEPCTRPGLYVFRRFLVRNADIDEVVALSAEAWRTFGTSGRYTARPMGLFAPADRTPEFGEMQLVTWYESLAGWAESRNFEPEAGANFARRRELTRSTIAVATALVTGKQDGPTIP